MEEKESSSIILTHLVFTTKGVILLTNSIASFKSLKEKIMVRPVVKLGAGVLVGVLQLFATGYKNPNIGHLARADEQVKIENSKNNTSNQTGFFHFKRDIEKGLIFIEVENDENKLLELLRKQNPGVEWNEARLKLEEIHREARGFNNLVKNLKQHEIKFADLKSKHKEVSKRNEVLKPIRASGVHQSLNIKELFTSDGLVLPIKALIPQASLYTRADLPFSITIGDGFEFKPESIVIREYLDPLSNSTNEGLYFEVYEPEGYKGKGGQNGLVVPLERLPFIIDTKSDLYLIGFDKLGTLNKGTFKVNSGN